MRANTVQRKAVLYVAAAVAQVVGLGCGSTSVPGYAQTRVVNAYANVAAGAEPTISVASPSGLSYTGLTFGQVTSYSTVTAGPTTVTAMQTGGGAPLLRSAPVAFLANQSQTLVISPTGNQGGTAAQASVVPDAFPSPVPPAGTAVVRAVNLSPDSPLLDVYSAPYTSTQTQGSSSNTTTSNQSTTTGTASNGTSTSINSTSGTSNSNTTTNTTGVSSNTTTTNGTTNQTNTSGGSNQTTGMSGTSGSTQTTNTSQNSNSTGTMNTTGTTTTGTTSSSTTTTTGPPTPIPGLGRISFQSATPYVPLSPGGIALSIHDSTTQIFVNAPSLVAGINIQAGHAYTVFIIGYRTANGATRFDAVVVPDN